MIREKIYTEFKKNEIKIESDVFDYGWSIFSTYFKYLIVIIPISLVINLFFEVLVFLILFIPLRRYIGGFHMKTMKHCFYGSIVLGLLFPYLANKFPICPKLLFYMVAFSCIYLSKKYGVIDHINKKLTNEDKINYIHKVFIIETIYVILSFFAYTFSYVYLVNVLLEIFLFCLIGNYISIKFNI